MNRFSWPGIFKESKRKFKEEDDKLETLKKFLNGKDTFYISFSFNSDIESAQGDLLNNLKVKLKSISGKEINLISGSSNITINTNKIDSIDGDLTQGIFITFKQHNNFGVHLYI